MPRALHTAILCGATPLLLGSLIDTTWRFTRWPWLETAGLFLIAAGIILVTTGAAFLVRHVWREFRAARTLRPKNWFHAVMVGVLLLANFPAAAIFTLSAIHVVTRYTVRVLNESGSAIDRFVVTGPGVRVDLGPIAPGHKVEHHLGFSGDGSLDFTARQGQSDLRGVLEGYVAGGLGGRHHRSSIARKPI
jgi:hypothetical protein